MVTFTCDSCNKIFKHKGNFLAHISKKISCGTNPYVFVKEINEYFCRICKKSVNSLYSIQRHLENYCQAPNNIENIEKEYNNKLQELDKLKKKMNNSILLVQNNGVINNTVIDNSNQTINNTFIVSFGHEDIDKLSKGDKKAIIGSCLYSIVRCVEKVHFNTNIPEQNNILFSNFKSNHGFKYTNGQFEAIDIDELIDEILFNRAENVRELLEKGGYGDVPDKVIEKIYNLLSDIDNGNQEKISFIKKEIKFMLYNNRHIVLDKKNKKTKTIKSK
jgi:hypothetical protein